jgi:GT2 family glycosyltransferase
MGQSGDPRCQENILSSPDGFSGSTQLAVLVTCHNRIDVTVRGLSALMDALLAVPNLQPNLFVVDDGSNDGTGEAVQTRFPLARVYRGDGSLYWNGGMVAAFQQALLAGSHDVYLLFNDDVIVEPAAVKRFFAAYMQHRQPGILVGATTASDGVTPTYGGFRQTSTLRALTFTRIWPGGETAVPCDTFNANFVAIPGPTMRQIGGPDPKYQHALGDLDLGLAARQLGVHSKVFNEFIGTCDKGATIEERITSQSLKARITSSFLHPYGLRPYLHFCWKHRPKILLPVYALVTTLRRSKLAIFGKPHSV